MASSDGWEDVAIEEDGWEDVPVDGAPKFAPVKSTLFSDVTDLADPGAWEAFGRGLTDVPLVRPLAERVTAMIEPGDYEQNLETAQDEYKAKRMKDVRDYPRASLLGSFGGGLASPTPGGKMKGAAGVASRVGGQMGIGAADAALRDESTATAAGLGGLAAALPEALRIKNFNRTFLGTPDDLQDYYLKNRAGVKGAKDLDTLATELHQGRDAMADAVSEGSGESYDILKKSGYQMPLGDAEAALQESIDLIKGGGAYDPASQGLIRQLEAIRDAVRADASLGPAAAIEAAKVKNLITQTRNVGKAYQAGVGGAATGTKYNADAVKSGARQIDQRLKDAVPDYRAKMEGVAAKTEAFKGVAKRFRDETATRQAVRRMMLGKDPEALKALKEFDGIGGTSHAKDLQDSYAASQFGQDRTRGSKRTLMGTVVGGAIGAMASGGNPVITPMIAAAGAAGGQAADVAGGKIAQMLLDLASTPYLGKAGDMLNRAGRKSPQAVLATHRWLMDNDKAYQSQIDALKQEDEP